MLSANIEMSHSSTMTPEETNEWIHARYERRKETFDPSGSDVFCVKEKVFTQQYAGLYFTRLNLLRPRVLSSAIKKWKQANVGGSSVPHCEKILDVETGKLCFLVGTVYVDMPLKPSILEEVTRQQWVQAPPPREKFTSDEDSIVLEDESGRVTLVGDFLKGLILITGITIAVCGRELPSGDFLVVDVTYPSTEPQKPYVPRSTLPTTADMGNESYVALVSGLRIGESKGLDLRYELLLDYLTGELGASLSSQKLSSSIVRVILAGDTVVSTEAENHPDREVIKNRYGSEVIKFNKNPIETADTLLSSLARTVDVDLMPGAKDPATALMPQQAILPFMFRTAAGYSSFHTVSNPYACEIGNVSVLGTSGQTIDSLYQSLSTNNRLQLSQKTLEWAHLSPTAPDTLWCHPFKDTDPFILNQKPHVYFIGNQPKFETCLLDDARTGELTRVVHVPSFVETGTIVLLNLQTLSVTPISFEV